MRLLIMGAIQLRKLVVMGLLTAAGLTLSQASPEVLGKIWSPAELIRHRAKGELDHRSKFVVQFRVARVRTIATLFPDHTQHRIYHLVPTGGFHSKYHFTVSISPQTEAKLKRLGITEISRHFEGKRVTVEGKISATVSNLYGSETKWTYHINLCDLDQLIRVRDAGEFVA